MSDEDKSDGEGQEEFESEPNIQEDDYDYLNKPVNKVVNNANVIDEAVDPSEAFAKFVQTYHDTSNNDFTDKITKISRPKTITVFQERPHFEGPFEKYNRLTQELKELKVELKSFESVEGKSNLGNDIEQEISSLDQHLKKLLKSKKYAYFLNPNYPMQPEELGSKKTFTRDLKNRITELQTKEEAKQEVDEVKGMHYELYQSVSKKSKSSVSISSLEKRCASLESTIGTSQLQMFPDIRSTIIYLGKMMEGLDKKKMKEVQTKMDYLARELKNVEKNKEKLRSSEKSDSQKKVSELYGWMGKWDEACHILPIIQQRLESIKLMVDAGQDSFGKLKNVVSMKTKDHDNLNKNKDLLLDVKKQFKKSLEDVKNVCKLEENFEVLARKMQQHFD